MAGLCHKSDLLQRAYLKRTRHGAKHGWLEGVGKRDDCSYLKNREPSNNDAVKMSLKKLNLPYFKCYRVYLELLNFSNVGEFLRTLSRFRKKKENWSSYVHFLYKTSY